MLLNQCLHPLWTLKRWQQLKTIVGFSLMSHLIILSLFILSLFQTLPTALSVMSLMGYHALLFHLPSGKLFSMPCTLCLILVSKLLKNLSLNVLSGPRCTLSSSSGHGHVFHVNDRRSFDIPFPLWHPFLHQMLDLATFILILRDLSLLLMDKRTCSLVSIGSLAGQRLFLSQISLLPLLLVLWFPG